MIKHEWITTTAGVKMPKLIYGTAWKKERTADLVVQAVNAGFQGVDTACQPKHYNEPQVGKALQILVDQGIRRESLFLQTKFTPIDGQDPNTVPYNTEAPVDEQVRQSFEVSRKNLQTEYIDSLVLHSPLFPHSLLFKAWRSMEAIYNTGGAHQLGISNCYDINVMKQLYADAAVKPAVLQNRFYRDTDYDAVLRDWCSRNDIVYQSFWTLTANPHILASTTVRSIAENRHKTEAQIFFRYLTQVGIIPLTGTCSEHHMSEDLSIFDFELSPDDLERITSTLTLACQS